MLNSKDSSDKAFETVSIDFNIETFFVCHNLIFHTVVSLPLRTNFIARDNGSHDDNAEAIGRKDDNGGWHSCALHNDDGYCNI
jgi:hypothetical protein